MVEHHGAVGLRGRTYITTHRRRGTCSDAFAHPEVSDLRATSLRFYTPEVHPPTPIGNFFGDILRGSVRCDA
eukprot:3832188-Pyramimonas_sp.AAC.1